MSDSHPASSTPFVPGFDFLQGLLKGAGDAVPHLPQLSAWMAPTLSEEELDKRIAELKSVHFWLDQNTKALAATVQALEVQKLTLATLKGLNVSMGDMAKAFAFKPQEPVAPQGAPVAPKAPEPVADKLQTPNPAPAQPEAAKAVATPPVSATPLVDPLQMWSALTTQFQAIAAGAMKEVAKAAATEPAKSVDTPAAKKPSTPLDKGKNAPQKMAVKAAAPEKTVGKAAKKTGPSVPAKTVAKPAVKTAPKTRGSRA